MQTGKGTTQEPAERSVTASEIGRRRDIAPPEEREDVIKRSTLDRVLAPDFFLWATGIEDTFISDPHRRTSRSLDEYALTQHYEHWREDIDLIASLGVSYARYGLPWYRIEASSSRFDFSWPDQVFERMIDRGVQPIVDLVHYGTPGWLDGGFGNPDYPKRIADYARRIAERYKGRVFWYTPLNEPRITAYYCGRLGWWPPYGRSWRGFVEVMLAVCRGIVLTQKALREVDPEIVCAHVDATDVYRSTDSRTDETAKLRQEMVFLALDLVSGQVGEDHLLHAWLLRQGVTKKDLAWFTENPVELDVIGLNLYPMFTDKVVVPHGNGVRVRMRYGAGDLIYELGRMYSERYRRPIFVSETAAVGRRRQQWMDDSFLAVSRLRQEGVPMVGYTWWPMFALIAWAYREKALPLEKYLLQLGLFDLELEHGGRLRRVPTKLVESYRSAVTQGSAKVGRFREDR